MPEQSNDYRVVVFGAGGVGKSSLVLRFVKGKMIRKWNEMKFLSSWFMFNQVTANSFIWRSFTLILVCHFQINYFV